jgi:prefoldin subunit 5
MITDNTNITQAINRLCDRISNLEEKIELLDSEIGRLADEIDGVGDELAQQHQEELMMKIRGAQS